MSFYSILIASVLVRLCHSWLYQSQFSISSHPLGLMSLLLLSLYICFSHFNIDRLNVMSFCLVTAFSEELFYQRLGCEICPATS
ncbi:Uncharacterized protein TCM_004455 [Theobroma cacao]|uniref:CAAX amino terminal protease family protein n=1 Tax=Theobroma cacao TaxID=3641 RepID=A0A061DQZ6_THECC|nr:Uncharacterized protein TCM_004455 [Theobroma cacao]